MLVSGLGNKSRGVAINLELGLIFQIFIELPKYEEY
jgi:hypothetical protein